MNETLTRPGAASQELLPAGAGIAALAAAQRPPLDRVPALRPIAEGVGTAMAARFTQLAAQEARLQVESVRRGDLAGYLADADGESTDAHFECLPRSGVGLVRIQNELLRPLLDAALGGCRGDDFAATAARPLTAIESRLVERLARQILADLESAFAAFAPLRFRFDRLGAGRGPARVPAADLAVVLIRFRADVRGREGAIDVALPGAAVDAARASAAGPPGDRGSWSGRLLAGIREVDVELEAVLHESMVDLALARDLKLGQTVPLGMRPDAAIALRCGGIGVAAAAVACRDDRLVLSVEKRTTDNGASP